jgi:hypothetical protein
MTTTRLLAGLTLAAVAFAPSLEAGPELRRLALVAGANRGGPERVSLRYAVADAERFASVMTRLGGLAPDDGLTLKEPTRQAFLDALAQIRARAETARREGSRVEVILYYSGHADEAGLMLGRETLSYQELRETMQGMVADVGITVLDACASGVITRLKGGRPRPAFLTDDSMRMHGHAFLTSSSENEAAQESERLQGSFFTHALVSGLRGAADVSGDGRVTLGEAYQFAFQETLAQTTTTQGGAQHPAYDIRMAGTGDVVMTDVRQASASLALGPDFDGRFYVRDSKRRLVAELYKPAGRRAEVAVEPGSYEVQYEEEKKLYSGELIAVEGERREVRRSDLGPAVRTPTRLRGPDPLSDPEPFALNGRTRVELSGLGGGVSGTMGNFFTLGLGLVHWLREDVALEGSITGSFRSSGGTYAPPFFPYTTNDRSLGLWVGARYYIPVGRRLRPFLRAGFGPLAQFKSDHQADGSRTEYSEGTVSSWVGAGLDWQIGHRFGITGRAGWEFRSGHGPDTTYGLTVGFTFGRAKPR